MVPPHWRASSIYFICVEYCIIDGNTTFVLFVSYGLVNVYVILFYLCCYGWFSLTDMPYLILIMSFRYCIINSYAIYLLYVSSGFSLIDSYATYLEYVVIDVNASAIRVLCHWSICFVCVVKVWSDWRIYHFLISFLSVGFCLIDGKFTDFSDFVCR